MKRTTLLTIFATLTSLSVVSARDTDVTDTILASAKADNIDLTVLPFLHDALDEITTVIEDANDEKRDLGSFMRRQIPTPNNIVDVHTHVVPAWYKKLVPTTGGNPTPDWTFDDHLAFMASEGIDRAIFTFSAPGPSVFLGNKARTIALARLINEQTAAYCKANPSKLKFYAHVPFPHTAEAITEATYALTKLGAVGIFLQSSVEGKYLGDTSFTPFFKAIDGLGGRQILFVHPADALLKVGSSFIDANPTPYVSGKIEFYFETARTLMDLTLTQTIHNFTNIHYVIPHVGGAFPSTVDRILKSFPTIYDSSLNIFNTRFWWDSAGPTYFHQVSGLLGIGVPTSQLLYGTDYPYAPAPVQPGSLAAVKNSPLFTAAEKTAIFSNNAETLFGSKLT
ncbi:hypothetical protein GALMADRAFT_228180 [Galerina marginata CBS 339.88]|uniref:Amidohydrolase-related domain-containing protein n=1 Tax=Galerina marginata (strain CBS 339.88) TaxID=685588 RepID=A0A067SUI1_GALM3|nr:hypothetical protein GALMADRAFT_228180 [Galerina marginata CBS 339.88]